MTVLRIHVSSCQESSCEYTRSAKPLQLCQRKAMAKAEHRNAPNNHLFSKGSKKTSPCSTKVLFNAPSHLRGRTITFSFRSKGGVEEDPFCEDSNRHPALNPELQTSKPYGSFRQLGVLFWGPYNKGSYFLGYYIRVPYFRKPPYALHPKP